MREYILDVQRVSLLHDREYPAAEDLLRVAVAAGRCYRGDVVGLHAVVVGPLPRNAQRRNDDRTLRPGKPVRERADRPERVGWIASLRLCARVDGLECGVPFAFGPVRTHTGESSLSRSSRPAAGIPSRPRAFRGGGAFAARV